MDKPKDSPLYLFHHITKTAGTTLVKSVFPKLFDKSAILRVRGTAQPGENKRAELQNAGPSRFAETRIISGHDIVGVGASSGRKLVEFAMFREPIDRSVSKWFHHKNRDEPSAGMQRLFDRYDDSVVKYLYDVDLTYEYLRPFFPFQYLEYLQPLFVATNGFHDFLATYPEEWAKMQEVGRQGIDKLDFVLLTKEFDKSVEYLSNVVGASVPKYKNQRVGNIPEAVRTDVENERKSIMEAQATVFQLMEDIESKFQLQMSAATQ